MSSTPQPRASRALTVMILDDDPQLRNAAVRILGQRGYRTLAAESAAKALEIATAWPGPLDLLICDLVLPGLSGREAANALQAHHPEMKVLFISGYSSSGSFRREVQNAGGAFLGKPFGVPDLLEAVQEVLADGTSRPTEGRLEAGS